MVTKAEASAALGAPAADGEVNGSREPECSVNPVARDYDSLYISIKILPGGRAAYDFSVRIKSDTFDEDFKELACLGDAPFTIGKEITVLKGDYVLVFFIGGGADTPEVHARVLALATAGTARLQSPDLALI